MMYGKLLNHSGNVDVDASVCGPSRDRNELPGQGQQNNCFNNSSIK